MVVIDSNSLTVLVLGLIDPKIINNHPRTSIYSEEDFRALLEFIPDFDQLLVLPNIWTELDNLLNKYSGKRKYEYIESLMLLTKKTTERYIASLDVVENPAFFDLGLTDSAILELAKDCDLLITSDSRLSDYARASGILVYDMVEFRNKKLLE